MDREQSVVGELEHDHLEEVSGSVPPDCEHSRRVSFRVEIDDHDCVVNSMEMSASRTLCRLAERWISTREYRNTK